MAVSTPGTGVEWLGGLIKVPAYVSGDGAPYRPEVLFWLDERGVVLSSQLGKPELLLSAAPQRLLQTIGEPLFGTRRVPSAIRVASAALARVLRAGCPGLEVRCAPTPELDALATALQEKFGDSSLQELSYLSGGVTAPAMASLFDAAATLFRAAPWRAISSDQHLLSISIEALGIKHAVLSVIGQLGKSVGIVLFGSYADYQAYLSAGAALARGQRPTMPTMPPHFTLQFERGSELPTTLRRQVLAQGWQVAEANAYPSLRVMDEDLVARMPTASEATVAEAIARALPRLIADHKPALQQAWRGGPPARRQLEVGVHSGRYAVSFLAACELEPQPQWAVDEVFAQYTALLERSESPAEDSARSER